MTIIPKILIRLSLVLLLLTAHGCSSKKVVSQSQWKKTEIIVDGSDKDWPETLPQFYDEENRSSIRVLNDEEFIYIAVAIGDQQLKQKISGTGFNLTITPEGEDGGPFAIRVDGKASLGKSGREKLRGNNPSFDESEPKKREKIRDISVSLPSTINVTYPYSSGPMSMSLSEAAGYGIEFAMASIDATRMVFEAKITLGSIVSEGFEHGKKLTLSFSTINLESSKSRGRGRGGMRGSGIGTKGGMRGGRGGMVKKKPYEAKMEVILAEGTVG